MISDDVLDYLRSRLADHPLRESADAISVPIPRDMTDWLLQPPAIPVFPVAPPSREAKPDAITTGFEAEAFMRRFSSSGALRPLFGVCTKKECHQLLFHRKPSTIAGWQLVWTFAKDSTAHAAPFTYAVHAFIPWGQCRGRAAEVVLDAFQRFLNHELREGLLFDGEPAFDPHRLDTVTQEPA